MSKLIAGAYCYLDSNLVIEPFYTVKVSIVSNHKESIRNLIPSTIDTLTKKELLSLLKRISNYSRSNKAISLVVYKLGKYELEKYPLEIAFIDSIRKLDTKNRILITGSSLEGLDFGYIYTSNPLLNLELIIAYLYSRYLRIISKKEAKDIDSISRLPNYYIESSLINSCLKEGIRPKWVTNYINNKHGRLINKGI